MTWSLGGIYEANDRSLLHEFLVSKHAPVPNKLKETDTIFDFYLDFDKTGLLNWKPYVP